MDQFLTILWGAVGTILTGLATWGTSVLVSWLNSKIKNQKVAGWITNLTQIISSSVQAVMQTYVDTLKKEGKFGEKEAIEAKQKALDIITNQLTEELKNYIMDNFGDIQEYLSTQIEAVVYNLKK